MDRIFHQGLVLRGIAPGGIDHAVVMAGKVLEGPVDLSFVLAGPIDRRFQVVPYDGSGDTLKELQGIPAAGHKICPLLCHNCLDISVLAIGENSDKYFNVRYFASITVDDLELLSGKVYEHFLPGNMVELHGAFFYRIFTAV